LQCFWSDVNVLFAKVDAKCGHYIVGITRF
jgi:hypothetical protein